MPSNDHDDGEKCPIATECPPCPPKIHPPHVFHHLPNNNDTNTDTANLNSETYEPCNQMYECKANIILAAIAALFFCCVVNLIICYVYFRCCANRRGRGVERAPRRRFEISRRRQFSWRAAEEHFLTTPPRDQGLCLAAVEALPVFVYAPENFEDGLQCAVCLSEFEDKEKGRVLPNCNHSFHVDCIDMWFYSHSTCPLCRAGVQSQPVSGSREVEISVREEGQVDRGEAASDGKAFSSGGSGSEEDQHNYSNNNECCVDVNMNDNLVEEASRRDSAREN